MVVDEESTYSSQMEDALARSRQLNEARQKVVWGWNSQLESQNFQNQMLHTQHLFLRVRIIRNVDKFGNFRWVDLFVFPGNRRVR